MCFSATASFLTAAATGAAGLVCLTQVRRPGELPLAATPLVFAAQQAIEGLLWRRLEDGVGPSEGVLAIAFLVLAQGLWPAYAPIAALLAEPDARRRRLLAPLAAAGLAVSAYLLWGLATQPHSAAAGHGHIVYDLGAPVSYPIAAAYLTVVSAPLLLSTQRTIKLLGAVVLAGSAVALAFYYEAFQSVWCYFAAAASVVILAHFQWAALRGPAAQAT